MSNRVVLVTGSTSGIGEAAAARFASAGDTVVFNSRRSVEEGERIATATPGSHYIQANVADEGDRVRLIDETLERFGRLDVLVNNAGMTRVIPHHDLAGASLDVWREIFETNLFGTWALSALAMDSLRASRGSIVNVSSVAGIRPGGSSIPYGASKAAINMMTAQLARVVGPEVRVNAVAPGFVDTPWWPSDYQSLRDAVSERTPLKRIARADDVADVIVWLANTPFITGQVVVVDGGMMIAN